MKTLFSILVVAIIIGLSVVWLHAKPAPLVPRNATSQHESAAVESYATTSSTPEAASSPSPTIGVITATPDVVPAATPMTVNISIPITDATLVAGSVNLLRVGPAGTQPTILGQFYDDGTHGDSTAGDHLYTAQVAFNEPTVGQVQLQASAAFKGVLKRVLSPIYTISVWQKYSGSGSSPVTFAYPAFPGIPFSIDFNSDGTVVFNVQTKDREYTLPAFTISTGGSGTVVPLSDWFSLNVDSSGLLINAGVYSDRTFADGTRILLQTGDPPVDWTGGPVAQAYVMSADHAHLAIVQVSQDNPLRDYGMTSAQIADTIEEIIQTIRFQ